MVELRIEVNTTSLEYEQEFQAKTGENVNM